MTFTIHPATSDDIADLAYIHVASKKLAEKHIVNQAYLDSFRQEDFEEKWRGFLATEDSQQDLIYKGDNAVGFISYGHLRTAPAGTSKIRPLYSAEIFAIYVHPDHIGQGYGKALLHHAVVRLKEQNHKSLCLWVLEKNKRARAFYEAFGGQRIGKHFVEMGPTKVKELCYGWRDISDMIFF